MRERLQKVLAAAGVASRRHAEAWLREGRVAVNGQPVRLGDSADPAHDRITVDGEPIAAERLVYWLLHKPAGVLTSTRDPEGRRTVLDLLPGVRERVFPVGRLDADTEGLVLLTNDGDAAQALLHPSLESEREYRVWARGRMSEAALGRLARGVVLEEGRTAPARVAAARFHPHENVTQFALVLHEGRKRQIRRAVKALGHPVVRLVRVRMGPLRLGDLPLGAARPLREAERRALAAHVSRLRNRVQRARRKAGEAPGRPQESRAVRAPRPRPPRDDD